MALIYVKVSKSFFMKARDFLIKNSDIINKTLIMLDRRE